MVNNGGGVDRKKTYDALEVARAIDRGLEKVAAMIEAEAVLNCPVDQGRLRASLSYATMGAPAITEDGPSMPTEAHAAHVGTSVIYAAIQEFGGTITPKRAKALVFTPKGAADPVTAQRVEIPPQPYLRPAFDAVQPLAAGVVGREVKEALER